MQDLNPDSSITFVKQNPHVDILRGLKALLPVGLLSLFGIITGEWFKFSRMLEPKQHFLIETCILFLDAYVLNFAVHWFLNRKKKLDEKRSILRDLGVQPFESVPKVFLSYFLLLICTQASFNFFEASPFPILFLLVFFIWAPYIVAFEFFAKPMPEDDSQDDFDPFDEMGPELPPQKMFMGKAVWRVGFNRSIDFATKNLSLSVALVFAIWIGRVLPEFFSLFLADPLIDFRAIILQKILEWACDMYLHVYIVWVMFSRLEPEEKQELEVELRELPEKVSLTFVPPFGLRVPVLAVLVLSATLLWSERKVQFGGIPNAHAISVNEVKVNENEIIFKLKVRDEISKLRWFRPERLRLLENPSDRAELDKISQIVAPKESKDSEKKKDISERSIEMLLLKREELVEASRYKVTNTSGELIETYQISPRGDELEVLIVFPIKKRSSTALNPLYELSYLSVLGFKDAIYTFSDAKK